MKINKLILLSIFISFGVTSTANSMSRCKSINTNCIVKDMEVSFFQKNNKATLVGLKSGEKSSWTDILIRLRSVYSTKQEGSTFRKKFEFLVWNESTEGVDLSTPLKIKKNKSDIRLVAFELPVSGTEVLNNSATTSQYLKNNPIELLSLARNALEIGEYGNANKWLKQLLEIREEEGGESLELADALHEMGSLNLSLGKYEKAAPFFLRALSLKEKILTVEHPSDAKTRARLGDLYKAKGELGKAESFYLRALAIYEKHSGFEEKMVADIWMDLGDIYLMKGVYGKSEKFYHRATAINKKVRGVNHPVIARINAKLAEVFAHNGDLKKGEKFYLQSIAVAKKSLGENHASYARAVKKLADFYKDNAHYKNAERSYQKVLLVANKAFGEKHLFVAETMLLLSDVYKELGDHKNAEAMKVKAINIYQ